MKKLEIRFERVPSPDQIEIVIRAAEEDEQVESIRRKLGGLTTELLRVYDSFDTLRVIPAEDVVFISVNGKTLNVVTENGSYTLRQSLQTLEETLDPRRFVRISRYEIVNLAKVLRFDFTVGGTLRLELSGGMETWAARRNIPLIRRRISGKE